jgi:phospholipid/cholesterol/gamma-HCH transport system substrate-binding protein
MKAASNREKRIIVRAGLFTALALGLAALVIFLIGKERQLFEKRVTYQAAFENVDGLTLDSPVRLGGLDVGRVTKISFSPDLGDRRIQVEVEVAARFAERVRYDSVAVVTNRGVLGDKSIDISLGSPKSPLVPDGGELKTGSSGELAELLKSSGELLDNAVTITRDLQKAVSAYSEPAIRDDVAAVVKSARKILEEVEKGDGLLHAVVYDKKTTQDARKLLSSLAQTAARLDGAVARADDLLREAKEGRSIAHASKAFEELGQAATQLAQLVEDAKQSKSGAVHQLVYGDASRIFADLGAAAADLKGISAAIRDGQGSLGALINDPTVYEDLKIVLGNLKRNRILKELVRYSISTSEDQERAAKIADPARPVAEPAKP